MADQRQGTSRTHGWGKCIVIFCLVLVLAGGIVFGVKHFSGKEKVVYKDYEITIQAAKFSDATSTGYVELSIKGPAKEMEKLFYTSGDLSGDGLADAQKQPAKDVIMQEEYSYGLVSGDTDMISRAVETEYGNDRQIIWIDYVKPVAEGSEDRITFQIKKTDGMQVVKEISIPLEADKDSRSFQGNGTVDKITVSEHGIRIDAKPGGADSGIMELQPVKLMYKDGTSQTVIEKGSQAGEDSETTLEYSVGHMESGKGYYVAEIPRWDEVTAVEYEGAEMDAEKN